MILFHSPGAAPQRDNHNMGIQSSE